MVERRQELGKVKFGARIQCNAMRSLPSVVLLFMQQTLILWRVSPLARGSGWHRPEMRFTLGSIAFASRCPFQIDAWHHITSHVQFRCINQTLNAAITQIHVSLTREPEPRLCFFPCRHLTQSIHSLLRFDSRCGGPVNSLHDKIVHHDQNMIIA